MSRPDSFFDARHLRRKPLTDSERLDMLDLIAPDWRVFIEVRRTGGWEMRSTVSPIIGEVGVRQAIDVFARLRNYVPRPPEPRGWRGRLRKLAAMLGVGG